MALRSRAFLLGVVLLAVAGAAGCSASAGTAAPPSEPPIVLPQTPGALKPATNCAKSTESLAPAADADGVVLSVSTDPSHTSLLLKNTGSMTVVVIPDASYSTRLIAAPYANPKDAASRVALIAVNSGGAQLPSIPAFVPKNQTITLPPQWAVCALSDNVKETASVRYVQNQASSAEYFVTKALADQLLVKMSMDRSRSTLIRCARTTTTMLGTNPGLPDIELYVKILGPRSACRAGYTALLNGDERAAGQLGATVLNQLGSAPRLLPDSPLLGISASP
ncbi:hypothetical protein [Kribbella sp. NPDC004536]|uniref:hypothetical protein n=1 Tax=Kribbella sp. NPDC004536 TaxID=3364106 RepID=UPI003681F642